jgi:hypothetical protein
MSRDVEPLNESPCWVVYGDSDAGKTKWARACLAAAGYKNPLVLSQLDGFKSLKKGVHDSIICDEMNFKVPFLVNEDGTSARNPNAVDCETAKTILEFEEPRDLQARTKPAYKPPGIPVVFCTNDDTGDIFPSGSGRSQHATRFHCYPKAFQKKGGAG